MDMTHALAFDTLKYSKRLVEAGFTTTQAEALAEEQARLIDERLATKQDLKKLEAATKQDLKKLEAATKRDLKDLETTLKRDITEAKVDILKWVTGLLLAQAAVIAALVKLL